MDITTLENWLWEAACAIRGPLDAPKFQDYILPLLFYKRLCDVFDDELERLRDELGLLNELSRKLNILRQQSIGATTKFLTATNIRNRHLNLPSLSEQQQMAHILQTADAKIAPSRTAKPPFSSCSTASRRR